MNGDSLLKHSLYEGCQLVTGFAVPRVILLNRQALSDSIGKRLSSPNWGIEVRKLGMVGKGCCRVRIVGRGGPWIGAVQDRIGF